MDSADLINLDSALSAAISAGTATISEVRDALGNSTRYAELLAVINARNALAAITTKTARKSCFDKVVFGSKS